MYSSLGIIITEKSKQKKGGAIGIKAGADRRYPHLRWLVATPQSDKTGSTEASSLFRESICQGFPGLQQSMVELLCSSTNVKAKTHPLSMARKHFLRSQQQLRCLIALGWRCGSSTNLFRGHNWRIACTENDSMIMSLFYSYGTHILLLEFIFIASRNNDIVDLQNHATKLSC